MGRAEIGAGRWRAVAAAGRLCVGAHHREMFARGFLYRGWSIGARPVRAIMLSSAAWTALHLQYIGIFGGIFCIGVWLGFLRWRFQSTG